MTDTTQDPAPRDGGGYVLFAAWAIVLAAFLLGVIRMRPPQVLGADAPRATFSAARAFEELEAVLEGGLPHPVGSDANHAVRDRIVARLTTLGLEPQVDRRWVVAPSIHVAAWVENVSARVKGREPGPAVVLMAHYDSVGAGPGASDDGLGVATLLEVARALSAGAPPRRDVLFLVTDGEEAGLLGARAWLATHDAGDVAAVVNVEARGTTGPSLMFQTGPGTAATVAAWAGGAPRPVTSSLFPLVYGEMPNDTDFTPFLEAGVPGLNFACLGAVQRYHTPLDSLAHVDLRTLQQHGDNALAAVRAFADEAGDAREVGEAVWFDVLAAFVVRWPVGWSVPLAVLALLMIVGATVAGVARRDVRVLHVLVGVAAAALTLALALGAMWGFDAALGGTASLPGAIIADPRGPLAVAAGCALFAAGVIGALVRRIAAARGICAGTWLAVAGVGVALAATDPYPAASYLMTVPALAAGLAACVAAPRRGASIAVAGLVPLGIGALLWLPLVPLFADAIGVRPLWLAGAPFALAAMAVAPVVASGTSRRMIPAVAGLLVALVGTAMTLGAAPYTPELPRAATVVWHRDEATRHAHWFVRETGLPIPDAMRAAAEFEDETERILPWIDDDGWPAAAPFEDLGAPALQNLVIRDVDGARRISFRLVSRRAAPWLTLAIEPNARVRRTTVGGKAVPAESLRVGRIGPFVLECWGTPPEGVAFELEIVGAEPVIAYVADATWGLPPDAQALVRARPSWCVPAHSGDQTVVHRKLRL